MRGDHPVPVELDEPLQEAGPADGPAARGSRRAVVLVVAALGLVLLTVAVVVSVSQQRQAADRRADLDALGWVLPSLDGPLEPAWTGQAGWTVAAADGVLVLADDEGQGGLRGVDARTGQVVWERGEGEGCAAVSAGTEGATGSTGSVGAVPPATPVRLVVCVPAANYARGLPVAGSSTPVVAVDPVTGVVVDTLDLPGSFLLQQGVDQDVVVAYVLADGALGAVRWAPAEGRVAWTFTGEPGMLPDGVFGPWAHRVADGVLTLQAVDVAALDLSTGQAVPADDDVLLQRHGLPDGAVVWRYDDDGVALDVRLVAADGTTRASLPGVPWLADREDGSTPQVLVVQPAASEGLVGLDAATGAELWRLPGEFWGRSPLHVDGLSVAMGPSGITVVATDDGGVAWSRRAAVTAPVALTDGRLLLVPVTIRGAGHLVALELATGVEVWRVAAPAGAVELYATAGVVVVVGAQESAGFVPGRDAASR